MISTTGNSDYQRTLDLLSQHAKKTTSATLAELIERYSKQTRPFFLPEFLEQDESDSRQRTADLIGGFPYVSTAYPWPRMQRSGLPMQPLIQLDLAMAGQRLGVSLGDGLVQAWGPVANNVNELSVESEDFLLRIVPHDHVDHRAVIGPEDWHSIPLRQTPVASYFDPQEEEFLSKPRIEWHFGGQMFGSRQQFIDCASSDEIDDSDTFYEEVDKLFDLLDESPLIAENNTIYLGGFGGQKGGEYDPSYGENLLFRLTDYQGFLFALHWEHDRHGQVQITHRFALRV